MRILLASPLANVVAAPMMRAMPAATVVTAVDPDSVRREISGRVRFDVVTTDLIWNRGDLEFSYDGFDVLDALRGADRLAPVLLTAQGHSMEQDHLDEARRRPEVFGVLAKASGFDELVQAVGATAVGKRMPAAAHSGGVPPLCELFTGRRGATAGRLAGAIATGRATDAASLAAAAAVAINTANKVSSHYLGPIIDQRGEHDSRLPMTLPAVYRWCGIHARYIVSWCRRNGHSDVVS